MSDNRMTDEQRKARKAERAAIKAASAARKKQKYAVQKGRTEDNKRKTIVRHLRKFPEDQQAHEIVTKRYPGLRLEKPRARAVRRAKRNAQAKAA
jgi:hypothetical protein